MIPLQERHVLSDGGYFRKGAWVDPMEMIKKTFDEMKERQVM